MPPKKTLPRRTRNALAWAALIVAALLAVPVIVLIAVIHAANDGEFISSVLSPAGHYKAIIFRRDILLTDAYHTEIAIVAPHAGPPTIGGEFFSCDDNNGNAPEMPDTNIPLKVQWTGTRSLLVRYPPSVCLYTKDAVATVKRGWFSHDTITIAYAPLVTTLPSANQRNAAYLHEHPDTGK